MATPSPSPSRVPKCLIVTLGVNPKGELTCSHDPFVVSKGQNDDMLVLWQLSPPGPFTVEFNKANGTPFYESRFDQDNNCSGLVRRNVSSGSTIYEYSVTIGGKTFDPGGRVDP